MGVNLSGIVKPTREIEFSDLGGKKIAIDAFNVMYQFISTIRDHLTGEPLKDSKGRITSHLSGIFYRSAKMLEHGIEPIYVFDGKAPEFKDATREARNKIREEARKKWQDALEKKDYEAVRRYSQQATRITGDMIEDAKTLLDTMGIPWVQATSEGEAQAAEMVKKGLAWATASQDWDSLMFNTPRFIKNLTITGRRKIAGKESYINIMPELLETDKVLEVLGINIDQLIILGILVGTDYNPGGIKGIGPKRALALVKEKKTLDNVLEGINWEFKPSAQSIFDFFKEPPVSDVNPNSIIPKPINRESLKKFLCDEREFSEERLESTLKKLSKAGIGAGQSKLGSFLR